MSDGTREDPNSDFKVGIKLFLFFEFFLEVWGQMFSIALTPKN